SPNSAIKAVPALLASASILAAAAVASGQTFNCTTNSTPTVVAVNSSRFSVRLSIDSTDSLCHILLVSSASSSGYFYVSLASTMESRYSRLRIQSDYPGSRVATISSSSQSRYQSFATKSNRLYASLSRLFSSRSTVDSVLLNVHLVTACPDGWVLHSGRCYGPASLNSTAASFSTAIVACRYVQANLAMGFADVTRTLGAALQLAGWTDGRPVWVGAAWKSKPEAVYFLNNTIFISSSVKKSCTSDSSKCRCVHYTELSTALFHRQSCSTKQSYLCSCAVGGDSKFYSLFSEDEDKTSRAWIVGVVFAVIFVFVMSVAVGTKIKQKLTIRRSISAANGPRFSTTDVISNSLYPEPLAPPSYNYGGNCDEQPPSYNEAVSTGAAVPSAPTPEEIYGAGHFQQAANWKGVQKFD
ncbi:hypothetical protein BOX15_Mlig031078g1, partial [Macrostomum lignano]